MGECCYYMKAVLPKKNHKKVFDKIKKFIKEGQKCYMDWQDNRDKPWNEFFPEFKKKYPQVADYIEFIGDIEDPNDLSGKLDFGREDDVPVLEETLSGLKILAFCGCDVWHFADWGPFMKYLVEKFGATKTVCATEEDGIGSLDGLQLYDYEAVVNNILENKKILPLLIGVNPELDEMIDLVQRGMNA